ncbi:MAG: DUF2256 and DUF3253 domain-containing protein [Cryobacterium sp.]|nr:DUF2256 and DUF3253 domain-containing protein [Oligoflexia bacterium]
MKSIPESKNCLLCGREMTWRKKWEKNWNEVRYCGEKCRRDKNTLREGHETEILNLLAQRAHSATICPSEVLPPAFKQDAEKMELVRQAARRLVHQGKIEILQKGQVIEPSKFRGPIRLRLKR